VFAGQRRDGLRKNKTAFDGKHASTNVFGSPLNPARARKIIVCCEAINLSRASQQQAGKLSAHEYAYFSLA
jgi:hypothetical protein